MLRSLFLLLFCASFIQPVAADERLVADVIAIEYPPFTTQDISGGGLSVDVLRERLAPAEWDLELQLLPPARAALDVAAPGNWLLSFFPPREGYVHVRRVVLKDADIEFGLFRMTRDGPFRWTSMHELAGASVVITRALSGSPVLELLTSAGLRPVLVNTLDQGMHMMASGRADYVLSVRETGYYYADKLALNRADVQFSETIIQHFPHTLFVNLNHPLAERVLQDLE